MATTYIMRRYNSIHAFVKEAKVRAKKGDASHKASNEYGENWSGTETFEEAARFAMYGGWEPEFAPQFRNIFEELVPKLRKFTDLNLERFPDRTGDEVNVAAYLLGDPDHMVEWVPQENEVTRRALCLLIGHSISSGCSSRELFIRGQAIIGLVRALSLLGYELEIWSEETVRGNSAGERYSVLVRLHAAGEIMDESAVEFAVGNPAWLRRLLFGFEEGEPNDIRARYGFGSREFSGHYGYPEPVTHANLVGADIQLNLGQTWFGENRGWNSDKLEEVAKAGVDWVVDQLKALGVLDKDADLDWSL